LKGALFKWVMNPKTDLKILFENNFQYVWSSENALVGQKADHFYIQ